MKAIQLQLTITLDDNAVKTLGEILAVAMQQAGEPTEEDRRRQARLRASQNALFAGESPPEDQGLLINSREAAKLLRISEKTLWTKSQNGEVPPPIRIGRAVRWSVDKLKTWIDAGCPVEHR